MISAANSREYLKSGNAQESQAVALNSGAGSFVRSEQYERLGVRVVENTPQEIAALAVKMDERLKGTWQVTDDDEELQ